MVCVHCSAAVQESAQVCPACRKPVARATRGWLVAESGPLQGKRFEIVGEGIRIGRVPEQNQLVLDDSEVSRCHASILVSPTGEFRLQDNSANGTYVNGRRVAEITLNPGDHIRFGLNQSNTFLLHSSLAGAESGSRSVGNGGGTVVMRGSGGARKETVFASTEDVTSPKCRLQLVLDRHAVRDISLESGRLVLGRAQVAGRVVIDHPSVSEQHAEVVVAPDGRATLTDLSSRNGTFVNGERISTKALDEGDMIQLGACDSYLLLFRGSRPRALKLSEIDLNHPVIKLGRDASNTVRVDHPTVSSFHAEIRKSGNTFELIDLGSSNGTFVNGARVQRKVLQTRDRISLGAVQFVFDGKQIEQQEDGTRVRLLAQHLCTDARDFKTGKTIRLLDDISLVLDPCEFVGLLGPSGAGKSTLMDALNGFRPAGQGAVLLNDRNLYDYISTLRAFIGYLPQDDILHRSLTVRECLYYSAKLRLPDDHSEAEINARVTEVIKTLELTERAGNCIYQLSGGQRKRVSLGIELLSKPSLLFVDEPTAGQDPRTEMKMMELFREIANKGSTVVINTHLLGSFSLLDKVAVLVRGKLAFFGPSQEMLPYFKSQRPHEIFDRLQERAPEDWASAYRGSSLFQQNVGNHIGEETIQRLQKNTPPVKSQGETRSKAAHSTLKQFQTLFSRQLTLKVKDTGNVAALLGPPAAIAILLALMKPGANAPKSLFMMVLVALWFGCSACVREIVDELAIYKRERQRDLKITSYLGSKLAYLASLSFLQSGIFVSVMTITGTQENHFWAAWGIMWLLGFQGGLIGLLISAVASNAEKALYAFPLAMIPQLLLAGMLLPIGDIHPFSLVPNGEQLEFKNVPELNQTGMSPAIKDGLSPLMVARWGLEALADVYVHDKEGYKGVHADERYGYYLLNALALTMHPRDADTAREYFQSLNGAPITTEINPPMGDSALPQYLAVMALFTVVMCGGIVIALKRKEGSHAG